MDHCAGNQSARSAHHLTRKPVNLTHTPINLIGCRGGWEHQPCDHQNGEQ